MPTLQRDAVRLAYELHARNGPGPPLLLTHGFGADRGMWQPNLTALGNQNPVITWDMRGHGASVAPDDASLYTHEHTLADMTALLDHAGFGQAVLIGMSLGGFISLAFRRRFPDRVTALVLVDAGPGFKRSESRERWNAWGRQRADELERRGLAALPGGREQRQARHDYGAQEEDSDVYDSLGEIAVPTLIVVGSEDAQFLAAAEVMERRIPLSHKVILEGAGHAANLDAPGEFNSAVSQFVGGL